MIVDTHCHLYDTNYDGRIDDIIKNFEVENIKSPFVVGTDLTDSKQALELARKYKNIFAIIGMYPENCEQYNEDFEKFFIESLSDKKVVAIGEIGLDFHSENFNQELQEKVFDRQIKIAHQFGLPLSIHTRDAFERTLFILNQNKDILHGGVIHCFTGAPEIAKQFINLGYKLGFGGVCTFKNAKKVVDTLKVIDSQYILLETDAPYLSPEPHRGEINEPKYTK